MSLKASVTAATSHPIQPHAIFAVLLGAAVHLPWSSNSWPRRAHPLSDGSRPNWLILSLAPLAWPSKRERATGGGGISKRPLLSPTFVMGVHGKGHTAAHGRGREPTGTIDSNPHIDLHPTGRDASRHAELKSFFNLPSPITPTPPTPQRTRQVPYLWQK